MSGVFKVQSFELFDLYNAPGGKAFSAAEIAAAQSYMRDYKALGANTVTLGWGVPVNQSTGKLESAFSIDTVHFASFTELKVLADYAKSIGLEVILKPQAQTASASPTNNGLPDNINSFSEQNFPNFSVNTFLSGWATYMGQAAAFAEQIGARELTVGTENQGFDGTQYRSLWQTVINAARAQYHGAIGYDALYPIGQNVGVDKVSFWDLVDIIGVSAYYPMTNKANPTYADVLAGWYANQIYPNNTGTSINVVATLQNLSQQYGKPVEFNEFGVQSFHGVVNDASGGGLAQKTPDWQQQAWIYQSMFQAFSQANASGWFLGVSSWGMSLAPGQDSADFASFLANSTNFDIRGKDAGKIAAAWYGATNYLAYTDTAFTGSMANDRIALYGAGSGASANQLASFPITLSMNISSNILNGKTATLHLYIGNTDYGAFALDNTPSNYVDAAGVRWTSQSSYTFKLPAAVSLGDIRIVQDSAVNLGGPENSSYFIGAVALGGVSLTDVTMLQTNGNSFQFKIGASGSSNGETQLVSTAQWNNSLASRSTGSSANPLQVDGGDGSDTVVLLDKPDQYQFSASGGTLRVSESAGLLQNAVLTRVEKVTFADNALLDVATLSWGVQDSAAGLAKNIDDFAGLANAGKLKSVAFTDSGVPTLTLTSAQFQNDKTVLAAIHDNYVLNIAVDATKQTIAPQGPHNTLSFASKLSGFSLNKSGSSYTVTDKSGAAGVVTLSNVESLKFADLTVNLGVQAVAKAAPTADVQRLIELYVAFFSRLPDADGLAYWIGQKTGGRSIEQIADTFYGAGLQYSSLTGFSANMSNADFINLIYRNVLGRKDGADAGGMTYWSAELQSGHATRSSLVNAMLDAAHGYKGDATYGFVADLLDNRVAVAQTVAITWGLGYADPNVAITNGMAMAAAITPTDTAAALKLIGISAADMHLT